MVLKGSAELRNAIEKYLAGDSAAFDVIYRESIRYITRCVLNVLNRTAPEATDELQQDIIQDTYVTIATKLNTLNNPDAFLQWAGQIATNHALRTWKKDVQRQMVELADPEGLDNLADDAFIPEDILWDKEKRAMIRKALDELPDNQYMCVVEYFYNGLTEKEVAEKLGMPLNTVKTNLSRAKKKLRDILETKEKKSGVKLFSLGGILVMLLWHESFSVAASAAQEAVVLQAVQSATGITTTTATVAATTTVKAAAGSAVAKTVAGVLAATVLAGGLAIGLSGSNAEIPEDAFRYNGHSYYIMAEDCATWEDAQAFCESKDGYLAVITDEEENAALHGYLTESGQPSAYFGLYLDEETGEWKWVDGESVEYVNWHPSEPNNERNCERYGMFYFKYPGGEWNDGGYGVSTMEDTKLFLCEWDED